MGQPNGARTSFAVPQYNYKLNAFSSEAVMKCTYKHTLIASYICFIIQSIVNNFSPLLFVTYSREFDISLEQIALLVSYNFIVQMVVDMIGARYADRIGYRRGIIIAHVASFVGIAGLGVFPYLLPPSSRCSQARLSKLSRPTKKAPR